MFAIDCAVSQCMLMLLHVSNHALCISDRCGLYTEVYVVMVPPSDKVYHVTLKSFGNPYLSYMYMYLKGNSNLEKNK